MNIEKYWRDTLTQDAAAMRTYFNEGACIRWHDSNELFNLEEYIRANCEYPGEWDGEIERVEQMGDMIITAVHVWSKDKKLSFHVVSFIRTEDDKITSLDEYWGEDGPVPEWRQEKKIGRPINGGKEKKDL